MLNADLPSRDSIDLSGYPSAPWLWLAASIDAICYPLYCRDTWRNYAPYGWGERGGPLFYPLGNITTYYPELLSFEQYNTESSSQQPASLLENMYNYAFHTSSTSLAVLTTPTALLTMMMLVLILRTIKSVLVPLLYQWARTLGKQTHGEEWLASNEEKMIKFGEYVIRLMFHASVSFYGLLYFHDKVWWDYNNGGTAFLFYGYPHHDIEPGMAWYYLIQSAYNMEALLSLLELSMSIKITMFHHPSNNNKEESAAAAATTNGKKVDKKKNNIIFSFPPLLPLFTIQWKDSVRGDFREMMIHHTVTNLLIFGSSWMRFTRIGSMVFLIHDVSDIPVDLSKLSNFVKWRKCTMVFFVTMILLWFYTRLYILPMVIFRSILKESYLVIVDEWTSAYFVGYRPFFDSLIAALIALHAYWFFLLIKIGWDMAFKGQIHDYTEHKSGEQDEKELFANKKKKKQ